jgi:hypothetical protein
MNKIFLAALAALVATSGASATTFSFHEAFTGQNSNISTVTGTFDGTLNGNVITDLSNVSVFIDGVAFKGNGSLFTSHRNVNNEDVVGGIASLDGTQNNFWFTDSDVASGDYLFNNYFFSQTGTGDYAAYYPTDRYGYNVPSGGFTAVALGTAAPEPAAWALMVIGFGAVGVALRRKTTSAGFA